MKKRSFTEIVVSDYEKIAVLSKSHLCNGMGRSEVQTIAPFFHAYQLAAGTDIYEEGDVEAFLCLIVTGDVAVYKEYRRPSEKLLATLGSGETVGEVSMIDGQPRSASVVATSESILYALTRRHLVEMYNSSQVLWSKLIFNISASLCSRLRQTNEMLVEALENGLVTGLPRDSRNGAAAGQHPFLKTT